MTDRESPPLNLLCGSAGLEITPPIGTHFPGWKAQQQGAVAVADPLLTRVAWFERGDKKLCIVALDIKTVNEPYTSQIRQRASERFGIDPMAIMVHATQTHSAPALGDFHYAHLDLEPQYRWIRGDNPGWSVEVVDKTLEAMAQARAAKTPVRLGGCRTIEGRLAFNRRMIMRNGHAFMPWRRWLSEGHEFEATASHLEGPIDPELALVLAQTSDHQTIAALAHYTAHPVHIFPDPVVSADWPGAWAYHLSRQFGQGCTPVVLNGCCGDVNPWDPWDEHYANDRHHMGRLLMESSRRAMAHLQWSDDAELDWRLVHVDLPLRQADPEALALARKYLAANPKPFWPQGLSEPLDRDWARSAMLVAADNMYRDRPFLPYEIQVLRIGDVAIVGLPGEPFAEAALRIKAASPARITIAAHCTTHYVGYIPTQRAFQAGGHEVSHSGWSKFVPEALDMIVECAHHTIAELFR